MAPASQRTPVFWRGSAVFDYWLAHPEGLTVRPLNARVERAVGPAPFRPAVAVVVRAPGGRLRRIPAEKIVAVDPANEELILAGAEGNDPVHEHVARVAGRAARATAAGAAWTAPRAGATAAAGARGFAAGVRWLAPRLRVAAVVGARNTRVAAIFAARKTRTGARWLAPRVVRAWRRGTAQAAETYRSLRGGP